MWLSARRAKPVTPALARVRGSARCNLLDSGALPPPASLEVKNAQTNLLFQEAPGYDHGAIHGLLREPAHAVGQEDRQAGHPECPAVRAALPYAGQESGHRRDP